MILIYTYIILVVSNNIYDYVYTSIPYWLFPIAYSLLPILYWLSEPTKIVTPPAPALCGDNNKKALLLANWAWHHNGRSLGVLVQLGARHAGFELTAWLWLPGHGGSDKSDQEDALHCGIQALLR